MIPTVSTKVARRTALPFRNIGLVRVRSGSAVAPLPRKTVDADTSKKPVLQREVHSQTFSHQAHYDSSSVARDAAKRATESAQDGSAAGNYSEPREITEEVSAGAKRSHFEDWMINLRGEDAWLAKERNLDWYTGKPPVHGHCPGVDVDGRISSLPLPNLASVTRAATQEYFDNSWTLVENLFAGFKGEEPFYRPPVHGLRHPQIFYYGHTPCFYVNKLRVAGVLDGPVNDHFESIFEVGVDEMLWDDMHKNDMIWPTVKEVHDYRKKVYNVVSNIIATHPALEEGTRVTWEHPMWALFMGFEHERIHLETSSVLFRETPVEFMQVPVGWPAPHPSVSRPCATKVNPKEGADFPANRMLPVQGDSVELGKPRDHPSYGFDNEYGSRTVRVPDFFASEFMVTNGEFWHFVKSGAYRVITEAEHHLIRSTEARPRRAREDPSLDRATWASGPRFAAASEPGAANLNHAYATQSPVYALPPSPTGHYDTMGNAWEWTEDHFNPLPGFEVHHVYDDFSTPCFDGRHHIIMGGSFMSSGAAGASAFCRYHFRPHFLQHSGFRLVSTSQPAPATLLDSAQVSGGVSSTSDQRGGKPALSAGEAVYETSDLLDQYLGLHFPSSGLDTECRAVADHCATALAHAQRFPQRVAQLLASMRPKRTNGRALDLGCAVGGASFELSANAFDEVVGIDFSSSFVEAAKKMQRGEGIRFRIPNEGELFVEVLARHDPHVDASARARVVFRTGDACKLHEDKDLGTFDGAILANLLCRLPEPLACLDGLQAVLNPGGVAVIVTPFSWLDQWTHRSKWLGGFRDAGRVVSSKQRLAEEMSLRGFEKVREEQIPLVIREHRRKYQYIISEATAWRKH